MIVVDPEYLTLSYRLSYLGMPDARESPETYPLEWHIDIHATVFPDDDSDGEEHSVGSAVIYTILKAGRIDLFHTLDAVDQELASFGELLDVMRPDLLDEAGLKDLGGDLMILSSLLINPDYRGQWLGHHVLWAVLATIGRSVALVALRAAPLLEDDGPEEGTPEHETAKAQLRSYWETFGFVPVLQDELGDYLVYFTAPHGESEEIVPI
jgi:GNAT superfamily N-acetyltransferase